MKKIFKELPQTILGADVAVKCDTAHWVFGPLQITATPAGSREALGTCLVGFAVPEGGWIVGYHFRDHPSCFRAAKGCAEVEHIALEYVDMARTSLECAVAVANSDLLAFDALTTPTKRRRRK